MKIENTFSHMKWKKCKRRKPKGEKWELTNKNLSIVITQVPFFIILTILLRHSILPSTVFFMSHSIFRVRIGTFTKFESSNAGSIPMWCSQRICLYTQCLNSKLLIKNEAKFVSFFFFVIVIFNPTLISFCVFAPIYVNLNRKPRKIEKH